MKRRYLLAAGLGAPLATLAAPAIVRAQGKYPERTVRLVVPFAPAGPTDIIGRKVVGEDDGPARPDHDRRQQGRRRRLDRCGRGQERQARRLHPAVRAVLDPRRQSDGVRHAGLRRDQGLHADLLDLRQSPGAGHPSLDARLGDGPGRGNEEEPRQVFLRLVGQRQHPPSRRRVLQTRGRRHGCRARALSRLGACPAGSAVGPGRLDVRDLQHDLAAAPRRQAPHPGLCLCQAGRPSRRKFRP